MPGRAGGRDFRARFSHIWTLRNGKVIRLEGIVDTAAIARAFAPDLERVAS